MPVINKEDFSAFDEALKKAPAAKASDDDFSAFDEALKKKGGGQESKNGGQESKPVGNPPTPLQSPLSSQDGEEKPSWQTNALNPAYSAQQAQIRTGEPIPKQKDWKDIVFDKSSFNKPIASDATYVSKNVTGEKMEQVTKSRANMQIAIDNTTERALKAKGLSAPKNSPAYIKQRKKVEDAIQNGDAAYTIDPATKQPALSQTTGFFESIKNSFISAVNDEDESDEFVNNMDTQQRVDYANKKREEAYALTKEGYVGKIPGGLKGEIGQTIGGAIPFVTKMTAGTIAGAGLIAAAPETGGASLAGIPAVLQFAFTVKDAVNQGGKNEVMRRFDILKQQKPDASDFDLMKEAESGLTSGEITGGLTNLVFTAIGAKPAQAIPVIEKSLANTLKNTAHGTIKAGVELGTISAGGTAVQEIEAGLEDKRFKKSAGEIIDNTVKSFGSGLTTGILLHTATQAVVGGVQLPGQLRSAIKYSLSKENPIELQAILSNNEQLGNVPQGTTEAVMADLNSYNKSLEKTSQDLTPETQASVAGLIQKRDNLMSEMASKDATQIDPYLQQIDAINNQIKGITETNDPFAYEVNDVTGQPLNGEISEAPLQKGVEGEQIIPEHTIKTKQQDTEAALTEPTEEQRLKDIKEGNFVTFTYGSEAEIPAQFKDKISSGGETDGKKFVRVTLPKSVADYELAKAKQAELPEQKTKTNDKENITGLPSKVGEGEEPITTEPIKGAGTEEVSTGGVLQAPGAEGEGQGVGEKVGEITAEESDIEKRRQEELKQASVDNRIKPGIGNQVKVGQKFNVGSKVLVENTITNESYDPNIHGDGYEVYSKIISDAEYDSNGKLSKSAKVEIEIFPDKETADRVLQERYERLSAKEKQGTRKSKEINARYDAELKALKEKQQAELPKQTEIEKLRAEEQAEYDAMPDPKDEAKRKEIYDKYDKLITPLLKEAELPQQKGEGLGGIEKKPFSIDNKEDFYHGSYNKREGKLRTNTAEQFGEAIYFTTSKEEAEGSYPNVTKVKLNIENPIYAGEGKWNEVERLALEKENANKERDEDGNIINEVTDIADIRNSNNISDAAKELGYDAIILRGEGNHQNETAVLDPSKIIYPKDILETPKKEEAKIKGIDEKEIVRLAKPITDRMVEIEREFENQGYTIDTTFDNEIQILDKDGEQVEFDDLPNELKDITLEYQSATAKLGDISDVAREKALAESRKVVETEAEVIEPEKVALPEQSQEQVNQQELKETENLLNDGDKIRKEGKYVKDGVEYVRNEKGLGIKSEEGGSVRFTSEPGGGGVSVPFTYKLIESETLQPSHQDGLRNPNHFIWEAQPKNRNDEGSIQAEEGFANKPRFTEMGENTNAYSGAPVVNERGEVIQGNNRSAGLRKGYQRGVEAYKKSLAENAEKFGFTKEQVEGMKNPVLVREVAVSDSGAIELGNYDVKDLESGGKRRLDPVAITRRMPFELKGRISDLLFKGEGTLNQAIRDNTKRLMELINPYLNQAQRNTIFKDGELTQDGAKDLETVAQHFLFDGGDTALPELHDNLSHTQKEGLRKSLPHIFSTGIEKSIVPEVQEAIIALNDFAASKAGSFDNWLAQSDMFNNGMTPKDKYSPTAIKIAEILNDAKNQKEITTQFGKYAELVNDKPATMFDEATKGISKKEGIKQIFKTEYDESKRPAISEGGGKEIPTQEEPLPQPSTEPSAAKPAKPTTKAAAEAAKPKPTEAKPELPEQSALDKAREARKAAKEKLNAIRKGLGITPDPKKEAEALFEYHKALVTEAKEYIKAGIETVEEWAKEVGEKVNVALKSAWDEATGKVPPTEKAEDITYTSSDIEPRVSGVKKAITTPLREALGLPAVELPKMGTDIEELQQAKQRIDSGDVDPISMIDDILKNDRGYKNEKEVFDMQYYAHQLDAKDRELSREMSEADNDIDKAEIANRKQLLSDEIDKQTEAARKAGNKWGKIGYSMQPVIDTEFSMSRERNLIKEAYAGEVPQQVKEKIEIITKERDEAIAQKIKIEKDLADLKAKKEIEKKQKEVDAEQKGKSKKTREDFIKERQSIVDKIKKKWRDAKGGGTMYSSAIPIPIEKVKQLAAISPEVGELIKSHVEEGVSKLSDIVDNIHDLLKDQIDGLTKKDVLDLIGGKYSISKERSEAAKKVAEIRAEAKKLLKENPTPSEKMQSEIDRLNKKADNIEAKLREGVVIKEKESELNPYNNSEWIKADQRVVNAEKKMRDLKRDAFESQKNWYQKSLMWAGRAVRLAVLSGYKVLGKLASAATIGGAVKRIPEQAIGAIYNKVFSSIAKKAPIEGSSMALNSELKWYKEFFNPKKFVRNSWDILKTGTTYLNKKMGKSEYEHIPILYAATDLHQIIKDPVKRATFEASFDNAMRYAAKEGLDVTDPLVIQSIENAAFKRANYEIFQESNALTRKFTAWKNEMEQKGNLGATAKFVADFFIPISSVPTNIARRVGITSPFGLLKANVDVINAYRKGMENLKPEEADMIMRQLKQGTLGTALWMIGWFGYASFGGLYTKFNPNKQRDDEDLASDKMEVGGVEIPKPTQHALPLEVIQSAATARRLWNKYNEDEETSKFGNIAKAGLASIGAVAEQVPIIETPVHMIMATQDPYEAKKLGEDIKGRVQPQILKETGIISKEDKEKRIFTEKEMESDKYKNLINAKLNIPKIGRRLSYDIKPDEAHPKGKMTVDEFNKFSDLVAKYSHDNTDYITTKYAIQISKLKDLVSKESKDPRVLSEITVLSKAIESKLELAHKKAIEKARAELKFPTH